MSLRGEWISGVAEGEPVWWDGEVHRIAAEERRLVRSLADGGRTGVGRSRLLGGMWKHMLQGPGSKNQHGGGSSAASGTSLGSDGCTGVSIVGSTSKMAPLFGIHAQASTGPGSRSGAASGLHPLVLMGGSRAGRPPLSAEEDSKAVPGPWAGCGVVQEETAWIM